VVFLAVRGRSTHAAGTVAPDGGLGSASQQLSETRFAGPGKRRAAPVRRGGCQQSPSARDGSAVSPCGQHDSEGRGRNAAPVRLEVSGEGPMSVQAGEAPGRSHMTRSRREAAHRPVVCEELAPVFAAPSSKKERLWLMFWGGGSRAYDAPGPSSGRQHRASVMRVVRTPSRHKQTCASRAAQARSARETVSRHGIVARESSAMALVGSSEPSASRTRACGFSMPSCGLTAQRPGGGMRAPGSSVRRHNRYTDVHNTAINRYVHRKAHARQHHLNTSARTCPNPSSLDPERGPRRTRDGGTVDSMVGKRCTEPPI
jgi:hypothetical protein